MKDTTLGIIGFGNMARAILASILNAKLLEPKNVSIYNPTPGKADEFIKLGCRYAVDAADAANSDYILLGVKPFKVFDILNEIGMNLAQKCIIAIAAGITISSMQEKCAENTYIVRVMPNATLTIGYGASVIAQNHLIPKEIFDTVVAFFSCGGIVEILPEEKINAITAVSGSSPAFFYRIISIMVKNACKNGISMETAYRLAVKTMEGAAKILESTSLSTDELIRIVATPGGTTQAALESMDRSGFDDSLSDAMDACTQRTYELAKK